MRILLDECVNPRLRLAFPDAEVKTVAEMGWRSFADGPLLREAASQFDLFVTLDQNLEYQNPAGTLPLGILVLKTPFNDLDTYRPHFAVIRDAASRTKPGQLTRVQIG